MALPPNTRLLRLLALAPPASLTESLPGDLIQSIVLDAELAPARPEVPAVPDDADVERVRGVAGTRKAVRGFSRGESVEADELQKEARVAPRRVAV